LGEFFIAQAVLLGAELAIREFSQHVELFAAIQTLHTLPIRP
jgi:hypothetical protein